MSGDEGFTLIELLIVIIILGILAAIVVFAVGNTRDDAVQATCKTDAKSIQLSAEAVKTHDGSYPVTANAAFLSDPAHGGLLKAFPSSSNYTLTYTSATGADYAVTSSIGGCP
jgi:general secretion pathway protein G